MNKTETIVVKDWDDLDSYIINGSEYRYTLSWNLIDFEIPKTDLKNAVKILNALGQTLEYKEIEVIDTLEKWEEFQTSISKNKCLYYNRAAKDFFELHFDVEKIEYFSIEFIEETHDVELKILKED